MPVEVKYPAIVTTLCLLIYEDKWMNTPVKEAFKQETILNNMVISNIIKVNIKATLADS